MADSKGLDQIPVHLTPEMARILAAHAQLDRGLASIRYPKSDRWDDRETAIAVLEVLADYLSAITDVEIGPDIIAVSKHSEVLEDVITHFRQAAWGTMDRRLAPTSEGSAGAAHDDALIELKRHALGLVDYISRRERANGRKDPVAEARRQVANVYQEAGIKAQTTRKGNPRDITPTLLESWEKRPPEQGRSRAK